MVGYLVAVLLLAITAPANAYVDAGSGSYMLQVGLAAILAVVFTLKGHLARVRTFLHRLVTNRSHARLHRRV